jgi:2-dehydro-3-deoxyphosphogluconate aldolase / (4S)-4-hydroxy-2-oxoglutarate aldolase
LDLKNKMDREDTIKYILKNPLVPVFSNDNANIAIEILQASYDAGLRVFEFTNRGLLAFEVFEKLSKYKNKHCKDMLLGAGTINTSQIADMYIDAGAEFIVQPGIIAEVGITCDEQSITWIPGVMTPTEIYMAEELGAEMVKIFPANIMGSAYIKALRGPMPSIKIMVTGGIEATEASLHEWFGAGANVLGMGSQLFSTLSDLTVFKSNIQNLNKVFTTNYLPK